MVNFLPNVETVFAYVENGLGVGLLDDWCRHVHEPGMHYTMLNSYHPVSLNWKQDNDHPGIEIMRNELKAYFSENLRCYSGL